MTVKAAIIDKLKNHEYDQNGYEDAVGDIYTLIHYIADLEDKLQAARAFTPRNITGGAESRGMANKTIVIDTCGRVWARHGRDKWFPCRTVFDEAMGELPKEGAPYTVVYDPDRRS